MQFLAVVLDPLSGRAIGWTACAGIDRALAISGLEPANSARAPAAGLIHHLDRGSV